MFGGPAQAFRRGFELDGCSGHDLDNLPDGSLKPVGKLTHVRLAALVLALFQLLLLRTQPFRLDHGRLEDLNRPRHLTTGSR